MADPYIDEGFSTWPEVHWRGPGTWYENGWRFFAKRGAQGSLERVETPQGSVLRITRTNPKGDSALDREGFDFRILVEPKEKLFVRLQARQVTGPASLEVRLAEYRNNTWTGKDNEHDFILSPQFAAYTFQVTLSPATTEVNLAIRVKETGSIELLRVELGRVGKARGETPRILLPQGWTPNARPTLWWRGPAHQAHQVQLANDLGFSSVSWDSGSVERGGNHQELPEQVPHEPVYARVRVQDFEGEWSEWSKPTVIVYTPTGQLEPQTLVVYDLNPTRDRSAPEAFEQAQLVSALQGLVNRERPQLFVRWMPADDFWLSRLRQPGRWLEHVTLATRPDLEDLLQEFPRHYGGVVLWDPNVPATSNVASMIAGVENLLPIPHRDVPDSLYQRLVTGGPKLPVVRSLVGMFTGSGTIPDTGEPSSGSAKNDAYRWAIAQYLESGPCNATRLAYYIDYFWARNPSLGHDWSNHTLTNHDFFIQHQGFFWDLNVWDDEAPNDDPDQPHGTDYETLTRMLRMAAERLQPGEMIHCGGFTPWAFKYTDAPGVGGSHGAVPTEWETVRLLSAYNVILDADALHLSGLANASVYAHMPRPTRINQPPPPLYEECRQQGWIAEDGRVTNRTFIVHYVGDYDSAAWLTTEGPAIWEHFRRGTLTLPWAWNPNLMERGMPLFDEFIRTRTPHDYLWAGDSGAGYINPTQLLPPRPPSGLPSGVLRWQQYCARWFRRLDIRHVGFIINGRAGKLTPPALDCYRTIAGDGIIARETEVQGVQLLGTLPVVEMGHNGLPEDPQISADEIGSLAQPGQICFLPVRSVLRDPEFYYRTQRALLRKYAGLRPAFLNPAEFFYLLRHHLGGDNAHRAAFLCDTMPERVLAGQAVSGKLWLRNLGWDTWRDEGENAVEVAVELATADERQNPQRIPLSHSVGPGQMVEVDFTVTAPSKPGIYLWRIDLVEGDQGWFSECGNLPEGREVEVGRASLRAKRGNLDFGR